MSKDKRLTINQAKKQINDALDIFEQVAQETLHKDFGFGPKRQARFMERFKYRAHARLMGEVYKNMRRMVR